MDEQEVKKYSKINREYTEGNTIASAFPMDYMDEFLDEKGGLSDETFKILDYIFAEANAYCEYQSYATKNGISANKS